MHRVFKTWEDSSIIYKRTTKELEAAKQKTYNNKKDFSKWNLSSDSKSAYTLDQLCNNKALAFKELYPKQTEDAEAVRDLHGFFTNTANEEFIRIFHKNFQKINAALTTTKFT